MPRTKAILVMGHSGRPGIPSKMAARTKGRTIVGSS